MPIRARRSPPASDTPHPAAVVGALVLSAFLVAFGALHYGFFTKRLLVDTPLYERYGDRIVHDGAVPYRDFAVEYPPGALPVFAAPSLIAERGDFERYRRGFEVLMLLCGAAGSTLAGLVLVRQRASAARLAAGTLLAGLAPVALGPVVLSRFDLWPAALTIAGLAALVAGRRRLGHGILGGAVAAKLFPAVVLPLALAYVWRRQGRREALVCAAVAAGVVVACYAPFALLAPHGVWESLHGQATRPLQIESLGASLLLGAHQAWGYGLTQVASHGSDNLAGSLPDALASLQGLLVPAALVALWVAFARGPAERDRLLRYAAAAVCAFVALGKVISPQYLMWLVPLVPLVRGRRGWAAYALFLSALVLTQLWFPYRYIRLVYELDPRASWLVLARDLVLVALLLVLAWPERLRPRLGVAAVAGLVACATAAVAAAAVSSAPAAGPTHAGVLDETGVASGCGRPKPVPTTSGGTVPYEVALFRNPARRAVCVHVSLTARGGAQAFSAAYLGAFDPARSTARHLGDPGRCTNVAGLSSRVVRYAFAVPARAAFEVEVESCGAGDGRVPYALAVGAVPVPYEAASAKRDHGDVRLRWRGGRAVVYRERGGVRLRLGIARATLTDRAAPLDDALRYWLRVPGRFGWYGPVEP